MLRKYSTWQLAMPGQRGDGTAILCEGISVTAGYVQVTWDCYSMQNQWFGSGWLNSYNWGSGMLEVVTGGIIAYAYIHANSQLTYPIIVLGVGAKNVREYVLLKA